MKKHPIKRLLKAPNRSFFLFGVRDVGKTTWLENMLAEAV
jgi:predicted AAA+ superfamily ATPase